MSPTSQFSQVPAHTHLTVWFLGRSAEGATKDLTLDDGAAAPVATGPALESSQPPAMPGRAAADAFAQATPSLRRRPSCHPEETRRRRADEGSPQATAVHPLCGTDFFLAFSPEREDPGREDFTTTTPKVVGGVDQIFRSMAVWCLRGRP